MTTGFQMPAILEEDIAWACDALKLPSAAFSGVDGKDPRRAVLESLSELDVEACPGSGKTTLLVAKLAILSRNWSETARGICVLSHTNVARREIEHRLGNTAAGQQLLHYPHFVGTIHAFVNEFLALPWLRSQGFSVRMIDDEVTLSRRWRSLPHSTQTYLEKNNLGPGVLKIKSLDLDLGDLRFGRHTATYKALQEACRVSFQEGFYCHDEMFLVARNLLEEVPETRGIMRQRFPMLFMDEVQDNSEMQSELLHELFSEGAGRVMRQRYGDSNQAIYRYQAEQDGAVTDPFPNQSIRADIPNSHRFGPQIAQLAKPLGVVPQELVGQGPAGCISTATADKHAIFLFDDTTLRNVLPCYSHYLREIFSAEDLRTGLFTAVGAVHRPTKEDHPPRHIGHYWDDYDAELVASEPKPKTYCQYLMAGLKRADERGEAHHLTEYLAEGIFALARKSNPLAGLANRQRRHRYMLELLSGKPKILAYYRELVTTIAVDRLIPTPAQWQSKWVDQIWHIAEAIIGTAIDRATATEFLKWDQANPTELRQRDNKFRDIASVPLVEVRMGSIHSVKGETHTATLVCETYYKAHHLDVLKPWLLGDKVGGANQKDALRSRLRQHYVAMTRPTHLLCLAMRENSVSLAEIEKLKARGWRICRVAMGSPQWL